MIRSKESSNKTVCVSLPVELVASIDAAARREQRTRSNMVAIILMNHLNEVSA